MHEGQYVFSQIMDCMPWRRFQTIVEQFQGDKNIQSLTCADYFRVMAFAQLTYRDSLRDTVTCLKAVPSKCYKEDYNTIISRTEEVVQKAEEIVQRLNANRFHDFLTAIPSSLSIAYSRGLAVNASFCR